MWSPDTMPLFPAADETTGSGGANNIAIPSVLPYTNIDNSDALPLLDDFDFSDEMMDRAAQTAQEEIGPMPMDWYTDPEFFKAMYTNFG
jgi:hypothetical protein